MMVTKQSLRNQIESKDQIIHNLEEKCRINNQRIKTYKDQISNLKEGITFSTVVSLRSLVNSQKVIIEKLRTKVQNQTKALADLNRCMKEKNSLLRQNEITNRYLNTRLQAMTKQLQKIDTLNTSVQRKDIQIAQLKAALLEEQNKNNKFMVELEEDLKIKQKQSQIFELNETLCKALKEDLPINKDSVETQNLEHLVCKLQLKVFELEELVSGGQVPTFKDPSKDFGPKIAKIKSHFECPILLEEIESPVICPSGHTVDLKVYEQLVRDGRKDPFSGEKLGDKVVVNRFMMTAKEIINPSNNVLKDHCKDH
ncbi:unnamed protein product [Moneuplotes crassus]|uniref:U-box domain-containing protein n=1 Tax=Euplotes crassus TaxID=5936 RepID=A0AAD1XJG2_EUPCR|nr:unnamed protein product [Moneuplotes crassus]